jgi:hypothetical protein
MSPDLYYYWSNFLNGYLNVYPIAALACIIFYWLLKNKWKQEMINWLYVFNTAMPLFTLLNLIFFLVELYKSWYGQNSYEWYAFEENRTNYFRPYGWSYWLQLAIVIFLPQLLWFKKWRKSIIMTLLIMFFTSLGIWFERLIIYITSAYRDFLPSSWSTYYDSKSLFLAFVVSCISFIIISAMIYFVFYKRNKLPYSSAFLK